MGGKKNAPVSMNGIKSRLKRWKYIIMVAYSDKGKNYRNRKKMSQTSDFDHSSSRLNRLTTIATS